MVPNHYGRVGFVWFPSCTLSLQPRVKFVRLRYGVLLTSHSSMSAVELIRACAEMVTARHGRSSLPAFSGRSVSPSRAPLANGERSQLSVSTIYYKRPISSSAQISAVCYCEFAQQHSDEAVLGYIKTIAINVAHDHFKSLHSQKRGAGETDQLHEDFEPAAQSGSFGGPEAMDREIFLKQVDEQLTELCRWHQPGAGLPYLLVLLPAGYERQGDSCSGDHQTHSQGRGGRHLPAHSLYTGALGRLWHWRFGGGVESGPKRISPANVVLEGVVDFDTAIRQTSRQRRTG